MRLILMMFISLLLTVEGVSQIRTLSVIRGVVRDSVTGQPVENVNVFLSSTTLGVGTGHDGSFELKNVPIGRYDLIYSRVGYALKATGVELARSDTLVRNVVLAPKLIVFGDVEVSSEAAREFQRNLTIFSRIFFGDGPNAQYCEIANPDVLRLEFDPHSGTLLARADRPLLLSNKALGYQLETSLAEFHWDTKLDYGSFLIYPQFRTLAVVGGLDSSVWKMNRTKTYEGSFQHFLRSLMRGNVESEGFVVYSGELSDLQEGHGTHVFPDDLQPESLLGSRLKRWTFDGWLRITRIGEGTYRPSYISLEGSGALIDQLGVLYDPLSIRLLGRWSHERVANMLPLNE